MAQSEIVRRLWTVVRCRGCGNEFCVTTINGKPKGGKKYCSVGCGRKARNATESILRKVVSPFREKAKQKANPIRCRLAAIRDRAKRSGLDFNLTLDWMLAHFNVCEATGLEFSLDPNSPWAMEVDRKNPLLGYTMDNCRMVCAIYNRAKMQWTDADVMRMANALN